MTPGRRCLQCDALLLLDAPAGDLFCDMTCQTIHRYIMRGRPLGAFTTVSVRVPLVDAERLDRLANRGRVSRQVFLELLVSADLSSTRGAELAQLMRGAG